MTDRHQRLINTAIDTFALIWWTVFAILLVGGVIAALTL